MQQQTPVSVCMLCGLGAKDTPLADARRPQCSLCSGTIVASILYQSRCPIAAHADVGSATRLGRRRSSSSGWWRGTGEDRDCRPRVCDDGACRPRRRARQVSLYSSVSSAVPVQCLLQLSTPVPARPPLVSPSAHPSPAAPPGPKPPPVPQPQPPAGRPQALRPRLHRGGQEGPAGPRDRAAAGHTARDAGARGVGGCVVPVVAAAATGESSRGGSDAARASSRVKICSRRLRPNQPPTGPAAPHQEQPHPHRRGRRRQDRGCRGHRADAGRPGGRAAGVSAERPHTLTSSFHHATRLNPPTPPT